MIQPWQEVFADALHRHAPLQIVSSSRSAQLRWAESMYLAYLLFIEGYSIEQRGGNLHLTRDHESIVYVCAGEERARALFDSVERRCREHLTR